MKELTKIVLSLENCEAITVPAEDIVYMYLSGYDNEICYHGRYRDYHEMPMYQEVLLEIAPQLDQRAQPAMYRDNITTTTRLKCGNDIVSIELHFFNSESYLENIEEYAVDWNGKFEYLNTNQMSHINSQGNLCIKISRKTLEDYIKENNESCGAFSWFEWNDWDSGEVTS